MPFGISKEWVVSHKACKTLLWGAYSAIALEILLISLNITDLYLGLDVAGRVNGSVVLSTLEVLVSVPIILATAMLYVSMWVYWVKVDKSSPVAKTLWFFFMIFGVWLASTVYYFFVYRPQMRKNFGQPANAVQS